jgi:hypothetical protein
VGRGRRQNKSFNVHLKIKSYKPGGGGILVSRIRITDFSKIHVPLMARCTQSYLSPNLEEKINYLKNAINA